MKYLQKRNDLAMQVLDPVCTELKALVEDQVATHVYVVLSFDNRALLGRQLNWELYGQLSEHLYTQLGGE